MAIKEAIDEVIEEHARLGLPLYALREGKVVAVSARELRKRSKSARTKIGSLAPWPVPRGSVHLVHARD